MDELWEFQSAFHDCFPRSEPRAHFFDYEDRSEEVLALQQRLGYIPAGPHVSATLVRLRQLPITCLATVHGSALCGANMNTLFTALERAYGTPLGH